MKNNNRRINKITEISQNENTTNYKTGKFKVFCKDWLKKKRGLNKLVEESLPIE